MKKIIQGVIIGAILSSTIAFAASYTAYDATFKVLVNGKEFTSSKAVVIDGSTYLPLRAVGEVLNVPVNWNSELHQVEVGNSTQLPDNEYSRTNPAPLNTIQTYAFKSDYSTDYTASIRIMETVRGEKAAETIKAANMFNDEAKDGYEYIIAKVAFSLLSAEDDSSINANCYDFDFYSGNNEEYDSVFVVIDEELNKDLYAGGNTEGYIVGMVKKDDPNPKVAYGLDYNGKNGVWFALN